MNIPVSEGDDSPRGAQADPDDVIAATAARLGALAAAAEGGICPICCAGNTLPNAGESRAVDGDTDSFTPRVRSDKRSVTLLLGTA